MCVCVCVCVCGVGEERRAIILLSSLNRDIKAAGWGGGLFAETAGGTALADPRLVPFTLWPAVSALWGFSEQGCPLPPETPSGGTSGAVPQGALLGTQQ